MVNLFFKAALAIIFCCTITLSGQQNKIIQTHLPEVVMSKKILIVVVSKAGSTTEIAKFMADELNKACADVAVLTPDKVTSLAGYNAVIIGSPIYMGKWLSEARDFVENNQQILKKMQVAYFFSCLSLTDPAKQKEVVNYLTDQRKLVEPLSIGRFAGKMDYSKLSFFNRMMAKMVGTKEGDYRDWKAIKEWTLDFYQKVQK